jgi:hypothetical protein
MRRYHLANTLSLVDEPLHRPRHHAWLLEIGRGDSPASHRSHNSLRSEPDIRTIVHLYRDKSRPTRCNDHLNSHRIWAGGKNRREFVVGHTMLGWTVAVDLRNTIMWLVGIVLAVLAAGLMVWSDIGDGPLMVMGMLGILFIAVGARGRRSQHR